VLVLGDVILDEYVWGEVRRISPEAPVPVVEIDRRTRVPGGAANAAAGVVALGGRTLLGGVIGADDAGAAMRETVAAAGVDGSGLVVDEERPTTTKTRVIANAQQVVRTDHELRRPLSSAVERALLAWVRDSLPEADALLISDYRKGVVSEAVARGAVESGRALGKPVVIDPKGLHYSRYAGATVITPNEHDAAQAANVHVEHDDDLLEAARRLSTLVDGAALLITRGPAGMTLFADGSSLDIPARAREVYDVTGAGDTVVAVLSVALARSWELTDAVRLANAAAGVVVGKMGTSTVTLEELERCVEELE
jgi:D-beta-D-heptose 7-phosphate kinase/D-beta-D-heptose 1-phosphate adenosyltransferase